MLPADAADVMIVHAGWIYDEAVLRALAERSGVVLADDTGRPVAAHVTTDGTKNTLRG